MSPSIISLPSPLPVSPPHSFQKTNTVAVTSIPKAYFEPTILDVLRTHFATYGEINQWVPLPGFGRIIVVYREDDDAELAKQHCDPIILKASQDRSQVILRVYRADPNPLIPTRNGSPPQGGFIPEANFLRPPEIEKNFLISPPGSPPVGWEPIKEDPPNAAPLAEDLMAALRKLQINNRGSAMETLLDPKDGSGVGVYVQDCDGDDGDRDIADEDWVYGESAPARAKWMPVATAVPPLRSAIIA